MDELDGFCDSFLDDSHRAFRAAAARFAAEAIEPHAYAWEEAEAFDRDLYRQAAEAGLLGPSFPEALGGGGGDVFHALVMTEALLRAGSTGAVVGLGSLEIALPPILTLGTPEQQQRFVPPVLRGERIAALAISEPGAGSDVAGLRCQARREGAGYRLSGSKLYVTSGVRADQVTVLARTGPDPHQGLTFFVVERDWEGYRVSRALKKTGWRASDTAELAFEDVFVPESHRLGPEGSGFACLMRTFQGERLYLAGQGYALAQAAWLDALAYAREREAFGRPLTGFQVIRHTLADMAARTLSAKTLVYQCAAQVRAGQATPTQVALVKNEAARAAEWVCRQAVQVLGGMGYMRETKVERYSRDARLLAIGGGTSEIMNEIASKGLGLS
ncbi:MAG: acyl-CoA dehydrogenase family protein [Planctomycetota bacterium]